MEVSAVVVFGVIASLASMLSSVPQAVRILRTRRTRDLSALTYGVVTVGFVFWVAYGVALGEWPIIVTNTVCGLLSAFVLAMILWQRRVGDGAEEPPEG